MFTKIGELIREFFEMLLDLSTEEKLVLGFIAVVTLAMWLVAIWSVE